MPRSPARGLTAGACLLVLLLSAPPALPQVAGQEPGATRPTVEQRRAAAGAGDLQAALELAESYELGLGTRRDADEALRWRTVAAELGDAESAYRLGRHAAAGRGGSRDDVRARHWYRVAAQKGHAPAQLELAKLLGAAGATDAEVRESERWYERALIAGAVPSPRLESPVPVVPETGGPTLTDLREAARLKRLQARSALAYRGPGLKGPMPGTWSIPPVGLTVPGSLSPGIPLLSNPGWVWVPGTPWIWPGPIR